MKKIFTPSNEAMPTEMLLDETKIPQPRKITIEIIRQFARSYQCDLKTKATFSGIILN